MKLQVVLLATTILTQNTTYAGDLAKGLYTGISIGSAKGKIESNNLITNPNRCNISDASCRIDNTHTGAKIYLGYPLTKNWGLEGEYVDFGKILTGSVSQGGVNDSYSQKTKGFGLSLMGNAKVTGRLSFYGKAGAFHWISQSDGRFSPTVTGFGNSTSRKENGIDSVLGVGADYNLSKNWNFRLSWDKYFNIGESKVILNEGTSTWRTLDTDVSFYSLGFNYRF